METKYIRLKMSGWRRVAFIPRKGDFIGVRLYDGRGVLNSKPVFLPDGYRLELLEYTGDFIIANFNEDYNIVIEQDNLVIESGNVYGALLKHQPVINYNALNVLTSNGFASLDKPLERVIKIDTIRDIDRDFVILTSRCGDSYYSLIEPNIEERKIKLYLGLSESSSIPLEGVNFKFKSKKFITNKGYEDIDLGNTVEIEFISIFRVEKIEERLYRIFGYLNDDDEMYSSALVRLPIIETEFLVNKFLGKDKISKEFSKLKYDVSEFKLDEVFNKLKYTGLYEEFNKTLTRKTDDVIRY